LSGFGAGAADEEEDGEEEEYDGYCIRGEGVGGLIEDRRKGDGDSWRTGDECDGDFGLLGEGVPAYFFAGARGGMASALGRLGARDRRQVEGKVKKRSTVFDVLHGRWAGLAKKLWLIIACRYIGSVCCCLPIVAAVDPEATDHI
jgi:hypothetical protein